MTPRIEGEPILKLLPAHRAEGHRWVTILESLYQYYTIIVSTILSRRQNQSRFISRYRRRPDAFPLPSRNRKT